MTSFFQETGRLTLFAFQLFQLLFRKGVKVSHVIDQMYQVGVRSISITVTSGVFVGAIMAIQINSQLRDFGAQGFLGGLSTSVTIRDVGPVLIAFLLSGKVGAFTSAELGTMEVTDQLNAIRCLGMNPLQYIILPRMIAVVLSSFLLLITGLFLTILGGMFFSSVVLDVNFLNYLQHIPELVTGKSIVLGVVKSFIFGNLIAILSCYKGYYTTGGAEGVGRSVKSTSVLTLVCIIVVDFSVSIFATLLGRLVNP